MPVKRIACDHKYVALYRNNVDMVLKMMLKQGCLYPSAITLHLYGKDGEEDPKIYDDWENIYCHIDMHVMESYTWQG